MSRFLLWAAILLAATTTGRGQEAPNADGSKKTFDLLQAYYRHEAEQYEFTLDEAGNEKPTIEPTVMKWTSQDYIPVTGTVAPNSGGIYVWTYQGRAVVTGGIGSFPYATNRDVFHEFAVLIEPPPQPTTIRSEQSMEWPPTGMKPRPIPDAPPPATGATPSIAQSRRLAQMRKLAQEFQGRMRNPSETGVAKLRLLPAPIYRLDPEALETDKHNIVDGALFTYTGEVGTDPEMMLYIECRKTDEGLEWTYVPAAMTYLEMWLEHNGKEVWRLPNNRIDKADHNYFTAIVERIPPEADLRERIGKEE